MKCPNCDAVLVMSERQGVEIDYCPNCRGVWLDKGELDKILEKSAANEMKYQQDTPKQQYDSSDKYYDKRDRDYYDKNDPNYHKRKKKGFLGDFFDFD